MAHEGASLVKEIRTALRHLDDPAHLESHALARHPTLLSAEPGISRGQLLRRKLRLAIESLDPGPHASATNPQAICYQVLTQYAISKESILAIAARFDISERQAYRMLSQGIAAIAEMFLAEERAQGQQIASETDAGSEERLSVEIDRLLQGEPQEIHLQDLVAEIIRTVQPLADRLGVRVVAKQWVRSPAIVNTNRVVIRQAFLNLLSHAIRCSPGSDVSIIVLNGSGTADVQVDFCRTVERGPTEFDEPLEVARQLCDRLGIGWQESSDSDLNTRIRVLMPSVRDRVVLIIDDNQGIIALFRSFLRHQRYQVHGASSAQEALSLLSRLLPDIIILDVMMPDLDGWELLQEIRATEAGRSAHIIVCSVINDPVLSASLGADGFLHKPVERHRLLQLLERGYSFQT